MFFHIFSLYFTLFHFFSLLKLFLPKKVCWKPPLIWDPTETLILFSLPRPVINSFWYPRAKNGIASLTPGEIRRTNWEPNPICPFTHTLFTLSCLEVHFSFTPLILWMFQDRHLCNKFAITSRSHNTAQTLRHRHVKRSLTKWDRHDGRSAQDLGRGMHTVSITQISQDWHHKISFYHEEITLPVLLLTTWQSMFFHFLN